MAIPDRLDIYRDVLGPHAETLDRAAAHFARAAAGQDPASLREQWGRHGDPFGELNQLIDEAVELRIEYAAKRVAVATAIDPRGAEEMLAGYAKDLGAERAARIREETSHWAEFVGSQDAEWVRARAGELADPYPAPAAFDRALGRWVEDHSRAAAAIVGLERAEREAVSAEVAAPAADPEVPVAEVGGSAPEVESPTAAPAVVAEPEEVLDAEPPATVSGPEVEELIATHAAALGEELRELPPRELGKMAVDFTPELNSRVPELAGEIRGLETAGDHGALERARREWIELQARGVAIEDAVIAAVDRGRAAGRGTPGPAAREPDDSFGLD